MKLLIRLLFVFISLGISLALVELYMRREISYVVRREVAGKGRSLEMNPEFLVEHVGGQRRLVPNADVLIRNHYISGLDVAVRTNSKGFRGSELGKKGPSDERLLILGDSITLSEYLPEEQTFPVLLEKNLNQKKPSRNYQVINAGVTNIGTEEELGIFLDNGRSLEPDTVVLAFYLNDSRPPWGFSGELGDRGWLRRHSLLYETLFTRLQQETWLKQEQQKMRFAWIPAQHELNWKTSPDDLRKLANLAEYDWGAAWTDAAWKTTRAALTQLRSAVSKTQARLVLSIFPVRFQVEADYLDDYPQKRFKELAEALELPTIDLLSDLRARRDKSIYYDQCHFNAFGQTLVAQSLATGLEKLLPPTADNQPTRDRSTAP